MTRERVRDRAYAWALSELARLHPERFQEHLETVLKDFQDTCAGHPVTECPNRSKHSVWRSRLIRKARARARRLLASQEDLKPELFAVRKERERQMHAGTAEDARIQTPAAKTAEALRASRGTWMPVKNYEADHHGRAVDYARKVRIGGALLWQPGGDFEAEIRENGDGWTVWAVWLGDGPDE